MVTATITSTQVDPTTWHYDLTLNDTGTTNIGTFWFAWVPGADLMPTSPFSIDQPVSWTSAVTNEGPSDGFAIQWQASTPSALLTPGHSLMGFSFDSTTLPSRWPPILQFFPASLSGRASSTAVRHSRMEGLSLRPRLRLSPNLQA
jgi:hypothetical protein